MNTRKEIIRALDAYFYAASKTERHKIRDLVRTLEHNRARERRGEPDFNPYL